MKQYLHRIRRRIARLYQSVRYRTVIASNSLGTHESALTRLADAAFTTRHLLVTAGSDDAHVALCDASDIPLGVATDTTSAADDRTAVALLGAASSSLLMTAAEAISVGEFVYTAASGKVQDLPVSAGTYYLVGLALSAASNDGDLIEVDPCVPRALTI